MQHFDRCLRFEMNMFTQIDSSEGSSSHRAHEAVIAKPLSNIIHCRYLSTNRSPEIGCLMHEILLFYNCSSCLFSISYIITRTSKTGMDKPYAAFSRGSSPLRG